MNAGNQTKKETKSRRKRQQQTRQEVFRLKEQKLTRTQTAWRTTRWKVRSTKDGSMQRGEDWAGLALASKQIRRTGAKYLERELQKEMAKPTIEEYLKQHKGEIIKENLRTRKKIQ